ncbi:MAG: tyrosine-protein phosphatase [Pseudomonadota bacterium]
MEDAQTSHRDIHFDGAKNVRDLGGLSTGTGRLIKQGLIIRSDGLGRLTGADLERVRNMQLGSVVDFRFASERQNNPDRLPTPQPRTHLISFIPDGSIELFRKTNEGDLTPENAHLMMCQNYAGIAKNHAPLLREFLDLISDAENLPCLFHCTSGKDRTGVMAALLLRLLGVPMEDIVEDYVLSNRLHQPVDIFRPTARAETVAVVMSAHADFIHAFFTGIEQAYTSFETFAAEVLDVNQMRLDAMHGLFLA